jgi:hypothetical protein
MHAPRFACVILVDFITLKYLTRTEIMKVIIRLPSDNWLQNIVTQVRTTYENVTGLLCKTLLFSAMLKVQREMQLTALCPSNGENLNFVFTYNQHYKGTQ